METLFVALLVLFALACAGTALALVWVMSQAVIKWLRER